MGSAADELRTRYRDWAKGSKRLHEQASRYLPGGDTRASAHYGPFPLFMSRGEGCHLWDVDGRELCDFMNNFTSLIHGHAHPATVRAVSEQIARGSAYAAPSETQIELARMICERVPSVEELRFTSSGSEATNMCLRAARAFSGRSRVAKIEGGYHGSHEIGEMSLLPLPGVAGPLERPETLPPDRSINGSEVRDVVTIPYNEIEIARDLIGRHADELAAVIVEPVLGSMGMIPAAPEFLAALRELTLEHGVLLIFDEVITLRLGPGGVQGALGITPDLTAMGKIIGGGLPVGAFGGRREIVEVFNPQRRDTIMHASTFSGNALTMAAGIAALSDYGPEQVERINGLGDRLRGELNRAFAAAGIRGRATGLGSILGLHLGDGEIRHARDTLRGMAESGRTIQLLHLGLLRRGVFSAPRGMLCVSTPMGEAEIDSAAAATAEALAELRPAIEQDCPKLLL